MDAAEAPSALIECDWEPDSGGKACAGSSLGASASPLSVDASRSECDGSEDEDEEDDEAEDAEAEEGDVDEESEEEDEDDEDDGSSLLPLLSRS